MAKCGNKDCRVSTGIHEGLTFGSGELDSYGYWEKPCHICARHNDSTKKERRARIAREFAQEGKTKKQIRTYIARQEWLWITAWPYPETPKTPYGLKESKCEPLSILRNNSLVSSSSDSP